MLDSDVARLYGYETKRINEIVKSVLDMLVYKKENVSVELITSSHYLTATETTATGFDQENDFLGTTIVGLGSSISSAAVETNFDFKKEVEPSQVYVESMSVEELNTFINKLENFEIEDKPKVLQKTLNDKPQKFN